MLENRGPESRCWPAGSSGRLRGRADRILPRLLWLLVAAGRPRRSVACGHIPARPLLCPCVLFCPYMDTCRGLGPFLVQSDLSWSPSSITAAKTFIKIRGSGRTRMWGTRLCPRPKLCIVPYPPREMKGAGEHAQRRVAVWPAGAESEAVTPPSAVTCHQPAPEAWQGDPESPQRFPGLL